MKSLTCDVPFQSIQYRSFTWHPFHFERRSCSNSSFHLFVFFFSSSSFCSYSFHLRFISMISNPFRWRKYSLISHEPCNLELKTVHMLSRSSRTVISFDIIQSIIINCYHFMINIWKYVDGLMYDVSCYCFIFIFPFYNWKFGTKLENDEFSAKSMMMKFENYFFFKCNLCKAFLIWISLVCVSICYFSIYVWYMPLWYQLHFRTPPIKDKRKLKVLFIHFWKINSNNLKNVLECIRNQSAFKEKF